MHYNNVNDIKASTIFEGGVTREGGEPSNIGVLNLGIYTRKVSPEQLTQRRLAYDRQDKINKLFPEWREATCMRWALDMPDINWNNEKSKAYYSKLMQCNKVWSCPVCSARIGYKRASELYNVNLSEYHLSMITLTIQHDKGSKLEDLVRVLNAAAKKMREGKAWQDFENRYQIIGTITGTEVTYNDGWHPHKHILVISKLPYDGKCNEWLKSKWVRIVENLGGYSSYYYGLDVVTQLSHDSKTYITKIIGFDNTTYQQYKWTLSDEVTNTLAKKVAGMKPFELLDYDYIDLFKEYRAAMTGTKSLVYSHGLKKKLKIDHIPDNKITEGRELDILICTLSLPEWLFIVNNGLRSKLLDMIKTPADIKNVLLNLGIRTGETL